SCPAGSRLANWSAGGVFNLSHGSQPAARMGSDEADTTPSLPIQSDLLMAGLYKPTYLAKDANGDRTVKRKSRKWYGWYTDRTGKKHRVPLCMDKTAAQAMLGELIRRAEREEAGLLDPFEDHRKRPLAEHLAEFEADL